MSSDSCCGSCSSAMASLLFHRHPDRRGVVVPGVRWNPGHDRTRDEQELARYLFSVSRLRSRNLGMGLGEGTCLSRVSMWMHFLRALQLVVRAGCEAAGDIPRWAIPRRAAPAFQKLTADGLASSRFVPVRFLLKIRAIDLRVPLHLRGAVLVHDSRSVGSMVLPQTAQVTAGRFLKNMRASLCEAVHPTIRASGSRQPRRTCIRKKC